MSNQPDPARSYPPSPTVKKVMTEGSTINEPTKVTVVVKAFSHTGSVDPYEVEVEFRTYGGTAKFDGCNHDVRQVMAAIVFAESKVTEVTGVDEVQTLTDLRSEAKKFNQKCREYDNE